MHFFSKICEIKAPIFKNIYETLLLYLQVNLFAMHEKDAVNKA